MSYQSAWKRFSYEVSKNYSEFGRFESCVNLLQITNNYSQTSIYRASWEKANMTGKCRGTVNRGRIYINFHMNYETTIWGKGNRSGKWRDPINGGTVNKGLTVLTKCLLI